MRFNKDCENVDRNQPLIRYGKLKTQTEGIIITICGYRDGSVNFVWDESRELIIKCRAGIAINNAFSTLQNKHNLQIDSKDLDTLREDISDFFSRHSPPSSEEILLLYNNFYLSCLNDPAPSDQKIPHNNFYLSCLNDPAPSDQKIGYDLCLMSDSTDPLVQGKIYIGQENGKLTYSLVTLDEKTLKNIETNIVPPKNFTLEELKPLKNKILEITSKAGHTQKIPRAIHLIWFGDPLTDSFFKKIGEWKRKNKNYTVILWVENEERKLYYLRRCCENDALVEAISLKQNDIANYALIIKYLEEKNFWAASDLLRINLLFSYGGCYFDFDVSPVNLNSEIPLQKAMQSYRYIFCYGWNGQFYGFYHYFLAARGHVLLHHAQLFSDFFSKRINDIDDGAEKTAENNYAKAVRTTGSALFFAFEFLLALLPYHELCSILQIMESCPSDSYGHKMFSNLFNHETLSSSRSKGANLKALNPLLLLRDEAKKEFQDILLAIKQLIVEVLHNPTSLSVIMAISFFDARLESARVQKYKETGPYKIFLGRMCKSNTDAKREERTDQVSP